MARWPIKAPAQSGDPLQQHNTEFLPFNPFAPLGEISVRKYISSLQKSRTFYRNIVSSINHTVGITPVILSYSNSMVW
jgi:hypothetical protein